MESRLERFVGVGLCAMLYIASAWMVLLFGIMVYALWAGHFPCGISDSGCVS